MVQAALIAKLITSTVKTATPQVIPRKCLRSRLNLCRCTLCTDLCPNNALSFTGNTITVSEERCQGCMLCSTICPNDALLPDVDISDVLFNHLPSTDTITFTCRYQQHYEDNEVVLPCLAVFPVEALLYLIVIKGSSSFVFKAQRCSTCHNQKSFQIFTEIFDTASRIAKEITQSSLVLQTQKNGFPPDQPTRRDFLKSIKDVVSSQSRNQDGASIDDGQSRSSTRSITKRRQLVIEAQSHIFSSQRPLFSKLTENRVFIKDSCIPCNRCSGICPTGALRLKKSTEIKEVEFHSEKCSGCGLCNTFCKHDAISLTFCQVSFLPLELIEVKQS